MIEYSQIKLEEGYDEIVSLCGTWWKDSLFYKLYGIDYKVDKEVFLSLEKSGILILLVGREEGKMIACYAGIKHPYVFNPTVVTASEIVWCLDKEHRTFRNLMGLFSAIDDVMKKNNVVLYFLAVSQEGKYEALEKILERKGLDRMDAVYSKLLNGGLT